MINKIIKKNIIITLTISLLCVTNICEVLAQGNIKGEKTPIYVNARNAIAMDCNTGIVLFEKNSKEIVSMASTTKIMTTLVALNYGELDRKFTISKKAASIRGSEVGYKAGEKITLRELLYGLMLRSGNDAAIAIAEGMAGSVEGFCKLMNEYAAEIGLRDSNFESPHGLDSRYHYSTAYDLAVLTAKAKKFKLFNHIVSSKDIDGSKYGFSRSFHNINKILYRLPTANGVKTGYTGQAGKCLVTSASYNGRDIIIVTLNCTPRWKETEKIYKYVVKNYTYKKMVEKNKVIQEIEIPNSIKNKNATLICNKDLVIPIKKEASYKVNVIKPNYEIRAPLKKGDKIGAVEIIKDNEVIMRETLEAANDIKEDTRLIRKIKDSKFIKWFNSI